MTFASAQALTIRHIGRRAPALRDLDLNWEQGERLLLLGPSGAGKSTLALCLDGVIPHSLDVHWESGRLLVHGSDTRDVRAAELAQRIGVLFQDPEAQLVMLEIDDEIAFGMENLGIQRAEMATRHREARTTMGLGPDLPSLIARLSGGTKQRVALASLVAMRPAGIVLDEPTATLDPAGAQDAIAAFATLAGQGDRSLLLIEHRVDAVLPHIDRVAVIDGAGSLVTAGDPDRVFLDPASRLATLGVWEPELTPLARAVGAERLPRGPDDAAELILAREWPSVAHRRSARYDELLVAHDLRYRYPGATRDALFGASLSIGSGECVAVVGANGAGKTTLGLLLAGILRPAAGVISVRGRPRDASPRFTAGYVFQYPEHQFVARTVREDIAFGLRDFPADERRHRVDEALERFGLARLAEASPQSLSHGEKRRASVASAVVTDPPILVLDEPTFGQDRRNADALGALITDRARDGRAVIAITHDLAFVAEHVERVIAMDDGRVVFDGPTRELFARPDVLDRCALVLPPIPAAFAKARARRPAVPLLLGRTELERGLAAVRA